MKLWPALLLALFFSVSLSLAAESVRPEAPPKPSELNWTRRPVPFDHSSHLRVLGGEACASCHHPGAERNYYRSCADAGCHDQLNARDLTPQSYYQATHKAAPDNFNSCVSCHTLSAAGEPEELKRLAGCRNSVCHE
jgi:hypothetical protein